MANIGAYPAATNTGVRPLAPETLARENGVIRAALPSTPDGDWEARCSASQQTCHMVFALLAVLGVNLIVIVLLLAGVLARRRWIRRQPTAFAGAIRVVEGAVTGLSARWRRGYGRWVRDVLVWEKAPFLFRSGFVLADGLAGPDRAAEPGEVKRLGKSVTVVSGRLRAVPG
ncbi:hypothetical protein [Kitasatospora sp. NPDC088346]|uniref:hypothetical protein n=1 Tax=Kitasatospora sp. NPDC088346 TaxID=3364073 RepID=UPI0037F28341